ARLPETARRIRGRQLAATLKKRRDNLPAAMDQYYRFYNEITDLRLSNQNEQVLLRDAPGGKLRLTVRKINKEGELKDKLVDRLYDPAITREIRVYTGSGNDTVLVDFTDSPIRVRIIGGKGSKHIAVEKTGPRIHWYGKPGGITLAGETHRIQQKIHNNPAQTAF